MGRRRSRVSAPLVGFLASVVMFALLFVAFANLSLFGHPLLVRAEVVSADTLAPNADVEIAGVKVGTVKSIDQGPSGATISMLVTSPGAVLYRDATAAVRPH